MSTRPDVAWRRYRRTFTDIGWDRAPSGSPEGAHHYAAARGGVLEGGVWCWRTRASFSDIDVVRARDDAGHKRHHRAARRPHRADPTDGFRDTLDIATRALRPVRLTIESRSRWCRALAASTGAGNASTCTAREARA